LTDEHFGGFSQADCFIVSIKTREEAIINTLFGLDIWNQTDKEINNCMALIVIAVAIRNISMFRYLIILNVF